MSSYSLLPHKCNNGWASRASYAAVRKLETQCLSDAIQEDGLPIGRGLFALASWECRNPEHMKS